jgi:hypothetical protein
VDAVAGEPFDGSAVDGHADGAFVHDQTVSKIRMAVPFGCLHRGAVSR